MIKLRKPLRGVKIVYGRYIFPQICQYGYIAESAIVQSPCQLAGPQNMFFDENVNIGANSVLFAPCNKIHIKKNSFTGPNLFISTGNHFSKVGCLCAF